MRKIVTYLLSPFLILIGGCGKSQVSNKAYNSVLYTLLAHSVPEVSIKDIKDQKDSILFLDARSIEEYNVSHIKNAQFIGYDNFDISSVEDINHEKEIVIYCSVGYRSEKIAEKLIKSGFKNVSNLYGGIFEWVNQDQPVFINNEATQQVHGFDKTWGIWLNKGEKVY